MDLGPCASLGAHRAAPARSSPGGGTALLPLLVFQRKWNLFINEIFLK